MGKLCSQCITILATVFLVMLISAYFMLKFSAIAPQSLNLQYKGDHLNIHFNAKGVPIITASTFNAFIYAVGYMHAHYRLWDMTIKRSMASGRMSEIFGERTLQMDKFFRIYNFEKASEQSVNSLPLDMKATYQSFADGINDCAKRNILLPIEFLITRSKFADWTISNTLEMMKYVSFSLNMSIVLIRYVLGNKNNSL